MIGSGEVKDKSFDGSANTPHADALAAIEIARRLPQAIAQAARQGIITRSARAASIQSPV